MRRTLTALLALAGSTAALAAPSAALASSVDTYEPVVGTSSTMYRMVVKDDDPAVSGGRRFDIRLYWVKSTGGKIVPTIKAWARVGSQNKLVSGSPFKVAGTTTATNKLPAGSTFRAFSPIVIPGAGLSFQVRVKEPGKKPHTFGWIALDKTHIGSAG